MRLEAGSISEAERRRQWRQDLAARGLVEKKVVILSDDADLFLRVAKRTRAGERLSDVLFDVASTAAPPAAGLPPVPFPGGPFEAGDDDDEPIDALGLGTFWSPDPPMPLTTGCFERIPDAFAVEPVSWPDAPAYRLPGRRRHGLGAEDGSPHSSPKPDTGDRLVLRPIDAADHGCMAPEFDEAVEPPPAPEPAAPPEDDAVRPDLVSEEPGSLRADERLPAPSWQRADQQDRISRLKEAGSTLRRRAGATVTPPIFALIALAVGLASGGIIVFALRAPTATGHGLADPSHHAIELGASAGGSGNDPLRQRIEMLEWENARLADHLEALLSEAMSQARPPAPLPGAELHVEGRRKAAPTKKGHTRR